MRNHFADELLRQAKENPNLLLLTADLGFSVFEPFAEALPKQYLNTGCAEANTMSMAVGLALSGKKVFVYSIVPFVTMRCFEQVRNDVCMHSADVTIVGVGGGLAYGQLGPTHHATEDIAIMRSLAGMTVVCPGDPIEAKLATRALINRGGPAYLRLNKRGEPIFHKGDIPFEIGKAIKLREGKDVTLISIGGILEEVMHVADKLDKKNIRTTVLSMHTVKPLDTDIIDEAIASTPYLFTIEEHSIIGGLGSAVGEYISEQDKHPRVFRRFGIKNQFTKVSGDQNELREFNGLNSEKITQTILKLILTASPSPVHKRRASRRAPRF